MTAKLIDILLEKEYALTKEKSVAIGRSSDNEIVIPLTFNNVSRSQAVIAYNRKLEKYVIFDNFSFEGTYINNKRTDREILNNGDEITFGKENCYKFLFEEDKGNEISRNINKSKEPKIINFEGLEMNKGTYSEFKPQGQDNKIQTYIIKEKERPVDNPFTLIRFGEEKKEIKESPYTKNVQFNSPFLVFPLTNAAYADLNENIKAYGENSTLKIFLGNRYFKLNSYRKDKISEDLVNTLLSNKKNGEIFKGKKTEPIYSLIIFDIKK